MKIIKKFSFVPVFLLVLILASPQLQAQGKFEFGFHYTGWSLNIIKGMVEGQLDSMGEKMKDDMFEEILEDNPSFIEDDFNQDYNFNSSGNNWGFEIRWYPRGHEGSFSIGLSVEKTSLEVGLDSMAIDLAMTDTDTDEQVSAQATGSGKFTYKPLSFHLHFRWDIKPSWRVRPYFTFGFGFAGLGDLKKAKIDFDANYTLNVPGEPTETDSISEHKTLEELDNEREEGEESIFDQVPFIPFVQMTLGIKGELTKNVYLLVEGGVFNGMIYRGGLSFRF
ncbi:MAG: hypothetical protein KAX11_08155 [Candidatus Aminicenantes bacterium]|nr:hypothetical protein [Candidatus Aminicenantes bacterium]